VTYQTMCALRVYLRRGDVAQKTGGGFWRKFVHRPLGAYFVNEALKAGITHASLTYGNMGFARGAKSVAKDATEIPFDTLPLCVELVAPKPLLDQFVRDHHKHLADATLIMLEGVHVRSAIAEDHPGPGKVDYVKVGTSPESRKMPAGHVHATIGDSEPPPPSDAE
jgi:PII-like signaling protein